MKERIRNEKNEGEAAVLELLHLARAAAQKLKSAFNKAKEAQMPDNFVAYKTVLGSLCFTILD
jgi:hypothetical protein